MIVDITGVELTPGNGGEECKGNGNLIECCCNECNYLICCTKENLKCDDCTDADCIRKTKSIRIKKDCTE